jgi:hypothetical protein
VSESGGNDKVQYARYLGCHSAGTTSLLLLDVLNDDDSVLVLRAQCKRRRAMRAHVLHFANYPNTTQCKRQTLCLSFADRMRMITSSSIKARVSYDLRAVALPPLRPAAFF